MVLEEVLFQLIIQCSTTSHQRMKANRACTWCDVTHDFFGNRLTVTKSAGLSLDGLRFGGSRCQLTQVSEVWRFALSESSADSGTLMLPAAMETARVPSDTTNCSSAPPKQTQKRKAESPKEEPTPKQTKIECVYAQCLKDVTRELEYKVAERAREANDKGWTHEPRYPISTSPSVAEVLQSLAVLDSTVDYLFEHVTRILDANR